MEAKYSHYPARYDDAEKIPLEEIKYYDKEKDENTTYFILRKGDSQTGDLAEIEDIVVHLRYHDSKNRFGQSKRDTYSLKNDERNIYKALSLRSEGGKKRNLKTNKKNMRRRIRKTKRRS